VRETLDVAAALRLGGGGGARDAAVTALLAELGLRDCAATRVGGARARGVSGGERRRLSVAVQLVTRPSYVFLDECTTGLDAFAARNLCQTLAALASRGVTAVATLHQPRADILPCFAAALLLARGGRPLYFGPLAEMGPHFEAAGQPCPPLTNPGDHWLDISAVDTRSEAARADSLARLEALAAAWAARQHAAAAEAEEESRLLLGDAPRARRGASSATQVHVLLWRGFTNASRDVLTVTGLLCESAWAGPPPRARPDAPQAWASRC